MDSSEQENENGYVIYPASIGVMDLEKALEKAASMSAEDPSEPYRVEDCDTEKVIARFDRGQRI